MPPVDFPSVEPVETPSVEPVETTPEQPAPAPHRPRHRRVTTAPPDGSDPTPTSEPPRHLLEENDARLRAEKPPHY